MNGISALIKKAPPKIKKKKRKKNSSCGTTESVAAPGRRFEPLRSGLKDLALLRLWRRCNCGSDLINVLGNSMCCRVAKKRRRKKKEAPESSLPPGEDTRRRYIYEPGSGPCQILGP